MRMDFVIIDKPLPDDETKSKSVEEHLIVGHEPAQVARPAGELP